MALPTASTAIFRTVDREMSGEATSCFSSVDSSPQDWFYSLMEVFWELALGYSLTFFTFANHLLKSIEIYAREDYYS